MPLINYISIIPYDGKNKEELIFTAQGKIDSVQELNLTIDGRKAPVDFSDYRVRCGPFHLFLPSRNLLDVNDGMATCVSDGYWIMFIVRKSVNVSSSASCSLGRTLISIEYLIEISSGCC
jgi:hypothetical protein